MHTTLYQLSTVFVSSHYDVKISKVEHVHNKSYTQSAMMKKKLYSASFIPTVSCTKS